MVCLMTDDAPQPDLAHCSSCGCKMDVSALGPYTNVVCPDCGHHTRVKCELGQYLLTGRHAAGGMSMVFKARDVTLEREVAIKVLNEEYSKDEQRMKQFEHEAMITAAISHPHVVRVFTVGQAYGHYYIAMEMVGGENLEQRISREDAIGEDEVLPMAAEMISGLRAAKRADLIHRDMKPGNILFDSMGHVKIVDFGLALVTQGGKAKAEEIWATPYYVPPEALDGLEEDFRSDMYALGATLYHALSGRPPIEEVGKSTRQVRKAKESVLPLAQVAPWLNAETCLLVDKAMALNPADRYTSYAEMEEQWQRAYQTMQGKGAAEPIHSRERAQRRARGSQGLVGLILAGVAALVLIAAAVTLFLYNKKGDAEGAGDDVVEVPGDPSAGQDVDDPEAQARIGRMFKRSHKLLAENQYDDARDLFFRLMNDPDVGEPAASWAGIEAVVATWLQGNTGDATATLRKVMLHMKENEVDSESTVVRLAVRLAAPGVVSDVEQTDGSMGVVHLVSAALKNWEIGAWDAAVPLFQRVKDYPLPSGSPLLVYRKVAARYLADHKRLAKFQNSELPDRIDDCREQLGELRQHMGALETQGRAKFHIRIWQLRLHRHIRTLREQAKNRGVAVKQAPIYGAVLPKFRELVADAKFAEASELLQDVRLEAHQEEERDSWIYLADSASAFLGTLEGVIPEGGVDLQVEGKGGEKYTRILSAKAGGLNLQTTDGPVFVSWAKLKPESVLSIHQKAFRQTLTTLEGQLRTEQAIGYAWLAGMFDKAKLAARKLSAVNKNFEKRWASTMKAQHDSP